MKLGVVAVCAAVVALAATPCRAGSIAIPAIGLKARLTNNVNAGPAWWPGSARPGRGDTVAIAGHRTTHTHPFLQLDRLKRGAMVYVRWAGRVHAYVVTSRSVVSASDLHIADGLGYERLVLTACSLPDGRPTSSSWRIVVRALPAQ